MCIIKDVISVCCFLLFVQLWPHMFTKDLVFPFGWQFSLRTRPLNLLGSILTNKLFGLSQEAEKKGVPSPFARPDFSCAYINLCASMVKHIQHMTLLLIYRSVL